MHRMLERIGDGSNRLNELRSSTNGQLKQASAASLGRCSTSSRRMSSLALRTSFNHSAGTPKLSRSVSEMPVRRGGLGDTSCTLAA